jgi:hypothetical protein
VIARAVLPHWQALKSGSGGLRVADGQALTMCAPSRNSAFYQDFLQLEEQANPEGTIYVITDNLSSHDSKATRAWLEDHPRIRHAFIPQSACWLNLQEGWWRIFRRQALAPRVAAPLVGELVPEQLDGLAGRLADQLASVVLVQGDGSGAGAAFRRPAVQLPGQSDELPGDHQLAGLGVEVVAVQDAGLAGTGREPG